MSMQLHEIKNALDLLDGQIQTGLGAVNLEQMRTRIKELNFAMQDPGFWDDRNKAQEITQEASDLQKTVETWNTLTNDIDELKSLFPTLHPEKDPATAADFEEILLDLEKRWRTHEITTFLNGKYDRNNAIVSIHAGTGGKDAQDFAEMLMRMYMRYAERVGYTVTMYDTSYGEEVGLKSATFHIQGLFAYGYLKGETGVHRLIRQSPFNSKNTRETSFAQIEVLPEIPDVEEISIPKYDLRIDVFRAGGKGGQSVNKTDSAVRLTHLPTGIVVACQNERSQLQNKNYAMKVLTAKLFDLMEREQTKELSALKGGRQEISWSNQIRTYVLHPYKQVKDHRTNYEEHNVEAVLDGEIDGFIDAELRKQV